MKEIQKLKLSQLIKGSLTERQESQLKGGTWCYFDGDNQVANENEGKCSCLCECFDYYSAQGLDTQASKLKNYPD